MCVCVCVKWEHTSRHSCHIDVIMVTLIVSLLSHLEPQTTQQAQAAFALEAERRWCLTGTPLSNKIEDLFSLVKCVLLTSFWCAPIYYIIDRGVGCIRKLWDSPRP